MAQIKRSTNAPEANSITKQMIIGAGIGVLAISVFLIPSEAKPEWGDFWMIRPLIVTPLAGAMGGLSHYLILTYHNLFGINRIVARILSIVIPIIGLYLGIVLGLDTTMWD